MYVPDSPSSGTISTAATKVSRTTTTLRLRLHPQGTGQIAWHFCYCSCSYCTTATPTAATISNPCAYLLRLWSTTTRSPTTAATATRPRQGHRLGLRGIQTGCAAGRPTHRGAGLVFIAPGLGSPAVPFALFCLATGSLVKNSQPQKRVPLL